MSLLIAAGCSLEGCDNKGRTPLHLCREWDIHGDVLRLLFEAGADFNSRNLSVSAFFMLY